MDKEKVQALIDKFGETQIVRDRAITTRRYNLEVFEMIDGEKKVIETIEYLTIRQARELKKEYREEDGYKCDIVEDVTTDRNYNEIVFTEKQEPAIVCGKTEFDTPAATQRIIERDRRKVRGSAAFRNRMPKAKSGKTIRYTDSFTDPKSPLYPMYIDNVKRNGYTVINKVDHTKFIGLAHEVAEYLYNLLKSGAITKNDLDIRFNGV